jgi:RNA 3'-terminal phosphate cyclase (ATP)
LPVPRNRYELEKQKMNTAMIELDGSVGEGGGQILRTALTLSMITGQAFRIANIRANRPKPGLLRQHLTAVRAAAQVSNAIVDGAALGAGALSFSPGVIRGGDYTFSIGTAGSATLVLQTVLPALLFANEPSALVIEGGTHNGMAPPYEFIERTYLPLLARMGAQASVTLERCGFYPAGGGRMHAQISPLAGRVLAPISLSQRGAAQGHFAESIIAGIAGHVAERELETIGQAMAWSGAQLRFRGLDSNQGPGNAVLITLVFEHVAEVVMALGEKNVSAEAVAERAVRIAKNYLASSAFASEYLADQLMIPFALAGTGSYTATYASEHARTNARVIETFLPVKIELQPESNAQVVFSFEKLP